MTKAGVEVRGTAELTASFDQLSDDLDDLGQPGARAGDLVADDVRRRAPRRSGALRGSVRVDVDDHGTAVTVTAGGGTVVYAGVQNFGWPAKHIRARWFMRDALAAKADQVVDVYADDVDRSTNKVKGA